MPTDHRAELQQIRTFPSLVRYLRDEMNWPISTTDFDDLTFDYTPAELGIDAKNAAKIETIKRLRPLSTRQPWGIFFIKFEPKRLPVVALRRILSQLALKKRASANPAERIAWAADDLLFVSNYGEGDERQISFAHFSTAEGKHDLPTLKVLGWDNLDTPLHLDSVAEKLTRDLAWPDNEWDVAAWRETWRSAFTLRHREVITTSRDLSIRLAQLARSIRDRLRGALAIETQDGPLTRLMKAFQEALVHDLDSDGFADMYAQTIAYGLLSARVSNPKGGTADSLALAMPVTNPFLKELMETFLQIGGRRRNAGGPGIDFDELGVGEVVELLDDANMEAVVEDFGDRNPDEDPVIHFYELFLKQYDAKQRMQRGIFYTPRPVVSYIVRSVDALVRTELGLEDGLADVTTWREMAARNADLGIPSGVDESQPFIVILDPATGTGTFLVEAIDLIYRRMTDKWSAAGESAAQRDALWNDYVPNHLLPRLYGYELLMAPYAIAHLKVGLKLFETGYHFGSDERVRIYLTNSLEPPHDFAGQFEFAVPALAHEALAVNSVKRERRFTVVIGNPPYAQMSQNLGDLERELIAPYRMIDGTRIVERGAITFERNLQDDYVKFIRLGEILVEASGVGIVALITNHAFLSNLTLRGMRRHLQHTFNIIRELDLHGNSKIHEVSPDTIVDENVFDIQQGVAISIFARCREAGEHVVAYAELWGSRVAKYTALTDGDRTLPSVDVPSRPPHYVFVPQNEEIGAEYRSFESLTEVFSLYGSAITTARDAVVVGFDGHSICDRVRIFQNRALSDLDVLSALRLSESAIWNVRRARDGLRGVVPEDHIVDVSYRPFDVRKLFYHDALVSSPRHPTMQHMGHWKSLALALCRQQGVPGFHHAFVSRLIFDEGLVSNRSREKTVCFPLHLVGRRDGRTLHDEAAVNINSAYLKKVASRFGPEVIGIEEGTKAQIAASDVLQYIYAVLHSPTYRSRYEEFLKSDFPRVPLIDDVEAFRSLVDLGGELIDLHLMEAPTPQQFLPRYDGPRSPVVARVGWSDDTVWLDGGATRGEASSPGTAGFLDVPENVWKFQVGSYRVCEKWLKDRKGRVLTEADILQYQKIVFALAETIRLMGEIDSAIDLHGGWPKAFRIAVLPD